MSRVVPFRAKAPAVVRQRMEETLATTMYLVQTTGPTSFVVQEQNCDRKHKVLVGPLQTCSCGDAEICIHVLFVMLKVLRVPATNPTVWQKSLIDSEVDALLRGDYREKTRAPPQKNGAAFLKRHKSDPASTEPQAGSEENDAQRHEVMPGEVCAICQEDMTADQPLTFCRKGCGNNFHIECMKVFGESRKQSKEHLICPLCRRDWGDLALTELKKEMDIANKAPNVHKNVCCKKCQTKPIRNERYRCVQCKNFDLCDRCFKTNTHINHSFVVKKMVTDSWTPALRASQGRSNGVPAGLVDELQNRDLTANDFDLLLQLDQQDKVPIQNFLLSVLGGQKVLAINAKTFGEPGGVCSECRQSLRIQADVRSITCGHAFHESCLARSILSKVYVCPHPSCSHVLFPGMHNVTTKKKTAAEGDELPRKASLPNGVDVSLSVLALQKQPTSHARSKTAEVGKTAPCHQRPASQASAAELSLAALSIGLVTVASVASGPPAALPPLKDKTRTASMLRPQRMKTRWQQPTTIAAEEAIDHLSVGQGAVSTYDRLSHADDLRSELKKLDKERMRKQRLQREERVRQNLSNNASDEAAVDTLFPPVARNRSSSEEEARSDQNRPSALPKHVHERTSRLRIGADKHKYGNERTESTLPELSIGAIKRA